MTAHKAEHLKVGGAGGREERKQGRRRSESDWEEGGKRDEKDKKKTDRKLYSAFYICLSENIVLQSFLIFQGSKSDNWKVIPKVLTFVGMGSGKTQVFFGN